MDDDSARSLSEANVRVCDDVSPHDIPVWMVYDRMTLKNAVHVRV